MNSRISTAHPLPVGYWFFGGFKMKNLIVLLIAAFAAMFAMPAFAVIDVTAVTDGLAEVTVALSTIIGAMTALSIAIFGVTKVYRFISKRAGA